MAESATSAVLILAAMSLILALFPRLLMSTSNSALPSSCSFRVWAAPETTVSEVPVARPSAFDMPLLVTERLPPTVTPERLRYPVLPVPAWAEATES